MSSSPLQQLIDLLGGPENLPPKLPHTEIPSQINAGSKEDDEQPPPIIRDPNYRPPQQRLAQVANVSHIPSSPSAVQMGEDGVESSFTFDSCKGKPSPLGINFVPFIAVTRYCYKFAPRSLMQPLATAFFDAGKIFSRPFDL